jgi:tetratricopeptide (TPR) repeat protein
MFKYLRFFKYGLVLIVALFCVPTISHGQDLGSSNGLFNKTNAGNSKKAAPKTRRTKTAAKKVVPRRKPLNNRLPRRTNKAAQTETATVNQTETPETTVKQPIKIPQNDIIITVGDKTNGDFDELFEKAIEQGNAARDERQYIKAEAAYLRAQSLKIKDSRAIFGLGNLYSDQQRWEEAERAYRTAIEVEPTSPDAYVALSFVLTQPIIGANLAERYTEAEKLARRAIELEPKNAFAYDQLGVALELGGKISTETQNSYRKAIELDPTFALAYAHLGRLLRKIGLESGSSTAYKKAIEYSTDVPTMIMVADVMQSQQKYAESEQLLRDALKEDERNPTALYLLGRALTTRGNYEEAEKVLKKSAEVSPNSFVSYTLLGSMSMRRGNLGNAERYLLKAVKVVSPNEKKRLAQEFEAVGDRYVQMGKNKDAARVFRIALNLDREKTSLVNKLAKTELK